MADRTTPITLENAVYALYIVQAEEFQWSYYLDEDIAYSWRRVMQTTAKFLVIPDVWDVFKCETSPPQFRIIKQEINT